MGDDWRLLICAVYDGKAVEWDLTDMLPFVPRLGDSYAWTDDAGQWRGNVLDVVIHSAEDDPYIWVSVEQVAREEE